ncbi:MAG: hypothetical protein ACMZI0_17210 [Symbiopectobacterium sp.]|uniref:hypothetical protein n=1 Tax=Symbiopectobacterium sp. TaxID=2952789 RepID=UPI0039E7E6D7
MNKNDIYLEMLRLSLPHIRNVSTWGILSKLKDKSVSYEAQLVHNIYTVLSSPEFTTADIWFLNHLARSYCTQCDANKSMLYNEQVENISRLFEIVPDELTHLLEWKGPSEEIRSSQ